MISGLRSDSGLLSPAPFGEGRCQLGLHNTISQTRGLQQQIGFPQFCRLQVQGQGAAGLVSSEASPWLADGHPLAASSHSHLSVRPFPPLIRTPAALDQGPLEGPILT